MQRQVKEFHEKFEVEAPDYPGIQFDKIQLRYDLIQEELYEFLRAAEKGDLIETADAIGDMLYVVFGTAVSFGINAEAVVDEIHRSNLTKLGADGKPIRRTDGKVLKGPGYQSPKITEEMLQIPLDN